MTCPYCENEHPDLIQRTDIRIYLTETKESKIIRQINGQPAAEYFCLCCQQYFYWKKNSGILRDGYNCKFIGNETLEQTELEN